MKYTYFLLTFIIIFQFLMCGKNNPINGNNISNPSGLRISFDNSPKDTIKCGIDTLFVEVGVQITTGFNISKYPWGASEPVIIKVVKDSSYTSWSLPISFSIMRGFCIRSDPPSSCGFSITLHSEFRYCPQRYFYYIELVNHPTIRSPIYSFYAK